MKIAFDLDGTLWSYQKTFMNLQKLLQKSGHAVGILTVHSGKIRDDDLVLLRSRAFPAFDFFICKTKENVLEEENDSAWKLRMMAEHSIDLLFDDCDDGNDEMYQELMDSGRMVIIKPRYPLNQHYK